MNSSPSPRPCVYITLCGMRKLARQTRFECVTFAFGEQRSSHALSRNDLSANRSRTSHALVINSLLWRVTSDDLFRSSKGDSFRRRHEERHHVEGFHIQGRDIQGFDVQGWHEKGRHEEELTPSPASSPSRLGQLAVV